MQASNCLLLFIRPIAPTSPSLLLHPRMWAFWNETFLVCALYIYRLLINRNYNSTMMSAYLVCQCCQTQTIFLSPIGLHYIRGNHEIMLGFILSISRTDYVMPEKISRRAHNPLGIHPGSSDRLPWIVSWSYVGLNFINIKNGQCIVEGFGKVTSASADQVHM